jgi:hypothetical protein
MFLRVTGRLREQTLVVGEHQTATLPPRVGWPVLRFTSYTLDDTQFDDSDPNPRLSFLTDVDEKYQAAVPAVLLGLQWEREGQISAKQRFIATQLAIWKLRGLPLDPKALDAVLGPYKQPRDIIDTAKALADKLYEECPKPHSGG